MSEKAPVLNIIRSKPEEEKIASPELRPYAEYKAWMQSLFADQIDMAYNNEMMRTQLSEHSDYNHSPNYLACTSNDFTDADPRVLERFILVSVPKSKSMPVKPK